MIPGTIVFVYFGTAISNISDAASGNFNGGVLQLVLLVGGSVLAIVGVCYVSYVARKEVKKVLRRAEEEKAQEAKEAEGDEENKNGDDHGGHANSNQEPNINKSLEVEDVAQKSKEFEQESHNVEHNK